jgi:hypothetical protein
MRLGSCGVQSTSVLKQLWSPVVLQPLVATTPLLLLQAVFCIDGESWVRGLFDYHLIYGAAMLVSGALACCSLLEWRLRKATGRIRVPFFSIAAACLLLSFFVPGSLVRPLIVHIPWLCEATQTFDWETSRGRYTLVLKGTGTINEHHFVKAYLNFNGAGAATFSDIRFNPMRFQMEYSAPYVLGTPDVVRDRIENADLPPAEAFFVAQDVWQVLRAVDAGSEIKLVAGTASRLESGIAPGADWKVGGVIWCLSAVMIFQVVSRKSLKGLETDCG